MCRVFIRYFNKVGMASYLCFTNWDGKRSGRLYRLGIESALANSSLDIALIPKAGLWWQPSRFPLGIAARDLI
jgi:hypothetical protein